jgi:putative DNA primase/helicase
MPWELGMAKFKQKMRIGTPTEKELKDAEKLLEIMKADREDKKPPPPDVVARYIANCWPLKTLRGEIFRYNSSTGLYQKADTDEIEHEIQGMMDRMDFSSKCSNGFVMQTMGYLKRHTYIRPELVNPANLLRVKNGVLDLNSLKITLPDSKVAFTVGLPVTYDPKAKCPEIEKFISRIVEKKDISLIYEIIAWCLDVQAKLERFVVFAGESQSGKSTLLSLIERFIGKENCSHVSLHALNRDKFAVADFQGKMVNIDEELASSGVSDLNRLKALTSYKTQIRVERKFKEAFDIDSYAKIIFAVNQPPMLWEASKAIWKRLIKVNFPREFDKNTRDPKIEEKLFSPGELSGLLNLAIVFLKRLRENGDFSYTSDTDEVQMSYLRQSNPIPYFFDECMETVSAQYPDERPLKAELFRRFKEWCAVNKVPYNRDNIGFGMDFVRRAVPGRRILSERNTYKGIQFKKSESE